MYLQIVHWRSVVACILSKHANVALVRFAAATQGHRQRPPCNAYTSCKAENRRLFSLLAAQQRHVAFVAINTPLDVFVVQQMVPNFGEEINFRLLHLFVFSLRLFALFYNKLPCNVSRLTATDNKKKHNAKYVQTVSWRRVRMWQHILILFAFKLIH